MSLIAERKWQIATPSASRKGKRVTAANIRKTLNLYWMVGQTEVERLRYLCVYLGHGQWGVWLLRKGREGDSPPTGGILNKREGGKKEGKGGFTLERQISLLSVACSLLTTYWVSSM